MFCIYQNCNRQNLDKVHSSIILFPYDFAARDNKEDEILLFDEVLDNIAKVDKVLSQPGGSLVMAGRSGVGRRTALSLVAHMHQITVMSPKVSRAYGLKQFKNDLKTVSGSLAHMFVGIASEFIYID